MVKEVRWTRRGLTSMEHVLDYLDREWTARETAQFLIKLFDVIDKISVYPNIFRKSEKEKDIHEALITEHNLLFYRVKTNQIILLLIWDTRQHPRKRVL